MTGPSMEQIAVFEEKVAITPKDLSNEIQSFDDLILRKLRMQLEGKCSRDGYVLRNSLELVSRSAPIAEKGRFTGDFLCYLKAQGKVYNPPDGTTIEGDVIRKNKMGLYMIVEDAIRVMIPRDLHIGNEEFDSIELGDRIMVEIKKSRFQVNDSHILSVGQYVGRVSGSASAPFIEPASASASGPFIESASAFTTTKQELPEADTEAEADADAEEEEESEEEKKEEEDE